MTTGYFIIFFLVTLLAINYLLDKARERGRDDGWREHTGHIVKSSLKSPHVIMYKRGWETYYVKVEKVDEADIVAKQYPMGGTRYFLKERDECTQK